MSTGARARPYWLSEGSEECGLCLRRYVYEVEVRCVDCDLPVCPLCAVIVREAEVTTSCPDCHRAGEG